MMRTLPVVMLALCATAALAQQDSTQARDAYSKARTALQQRKVDDAVKLLESAVKLDGHNYEYHVWLGHAYSRQIASVNFIRKGGLAKRAGAEYNRAVELAPNSVDAAEARLEFFMNAPGIVGGGMDKARAEAARIGGLSSYRGGLASARLAEHDKDVAGAEREYRALVTRFPDSSSAVTALATFLQTHGRFDEAFGVVDQRLAQFPDDTNTIYQLGRIAALSGQRLAVGEAALRRFLAMVGVKDSANRASGHYRIGMIRERMADTASARAEYAKAVELLPAHEQAATAMKRLTPRASR